MSFEDVPALLRDSRQWVLRKEKRPCNPAGESKGWQKPGFWLSFDEARTALEASPGRFDGIGYVIARDEARDDKQILGIDFDCCRDPRAGKEWTSPRVLAILQKLNSYTEASLSGTGYHVWVLGKLPDGVDSAESEGFPLEDLPADTRIFIQALKKTAKRSDTIEIYENGRHFAMSGKRDPAYSANIEERQDVLNELLKLCRPPKAKAGADGGQGAGARPGGNAETPGWAEEMEREAKAGRLPPLSILDVAIKAGFVQTEESGGQIFGYLPLLGSSTGRNIVINEADNLYCYMHNGLDKGGDSWTWLACECGAVKWEEAGAGALKDPAIRARTLAYAVSRGLIAAEAVQPEIRIISVEDATGVAGLADGCIKHVVADEKGVKSLKWLSDCPLIIHTETVEDGKTEFTFMGWGAKDGRKVQFTALASDMSDARKFRGMLINAFGGANRPGKLDFDTVAGISRNIIKRERVTIPRWRDNIPLIPGLGLAPDVVLKLSAQVPAAVYDGDLEAAQYILRKLLKVHKYAPILVATVIGAPAVARWHKNKRFGLGLWGESGSLKTTIATLTQGIYGIDYVDNPTLKSGSKIGSTVVAAAEIFNLAGCLAQILDDVKTVNSKDVENYVAIVHGVIEGSEKLRSKKAGGLRDSKPYLSTPIITGEVRPQEASTSARVLNLNWNKADVNRALLNDVQKESSKLPIIGYHWLRFLAETDFVLGVDFEAFRSQKMEEFTSKHYVNPGRLAAIVTMLISIWDLLEASPLGDVFKEYHKTFKAVLDEAASAQGGAVSSETEIAVFLASLEELIASNPDIIQSKDGIGVIYNPGKIIGKWLEDGLFLLPTETINELTKIRAFTQQPTKDSITQALAAKDLLIRAKDGRHLLFQTYLNGGRPRGWYIRGMAPFNGDITPPGGVDKNDSKRPNNSTTPPTPPKKRKVFFEGNLRDLGSKKDDSKTLHDNGGVSGVNGVIDNIDMSIDSGFDGIKDNSTTDSTTTLDGAIVEPKDCSKCDVALKGDKSAIKCNPCTYLGEAKA